MRSETTGACWRDRFPENLSDEHISRRVALPAQAIADLGAHSPDVDARRLETILKEVFVPTSGVCALLRRLSNVGRAHALEHFPNIAMYASGLYQDVPPVTTGLPLCLTGHAGVGKSELLRAFGRMLGDFDPLEIAKVSGLPNVPAWHMRVNERASIGQLLRPILDPCDASTLGQSGSETPSARRDIVKLLQSARRRAHRDGVCLAFADEFQFRTQSQDATALITKLLYQLWTLGPRLVFVSNFSLLHSLKKRPDQDRDRLLSNPLVLHPHAPECEDWWNTLNQLFLVAPLAFELDARSDGEALHHYTFGVNRRLVDLLVLAYRMQREKKMTTVRLVDIESAQRSAEFSCHRETVNALIKQAITKVNSKDRRDLWCPFESLEVNNVISAEPLVKRRTERVQSDLLRSQLTAKEREVVNAVEGPPRSHRTANNVLKIGRPKVLSKESLLEGDRMFDETR